MTRKAYPFMAAMMLAMAANPHYSFGRPRMSEAQKKRNEEYKRERAHRLFPETVTEYEFTIHGEKIMARNKKTAIKIYNNRHKK